MFSRLESLLHATYLARACGDLARLPSQALGQTLSHAGLAVYKYPMGEGGGRGAWWRGTAELRKMNMLIKR